MHFEVRRLSEGGAYFDLIVKLYGAYFEIQGYKRKCGTTEDAQYSENQNQLRKCCI